MAIRKLVFIISVVLSLAFPLSAFAAKLRQIPGAAEAPSSGRTTTLLPNGSWLLAGGQDATGHAVGKLTVRDAVGNDEHLALSLQFPRMWHTTTVMPDGKVLILGGIGVDRQIVEQAEIFDPEIGSSQLLTSGAPHPRAFHSATLLTDGRVLIAGGVGADGEPLLSAELWDPRQKTDSIPTGELSVARTNHLAALLPDGRVLLSGGRDGAGKPVLTADIYDVQSQSFSPATDVPSLLSSNDSIAEARASSPEDGATDVPVSALISMRFSRPLRIETINNQTVLLSGPAGTVDAKVIGAEGGMLAFMAPKTALLAGTTYSVRFSGATDTEHRTAAFFEFGFTTTGGVPDSDMWIPNANWTSNRPSSTWQSMPPLQAGPGVTALAGQVLKLDGTPLKHVTLMIGARKAFSDGTGRFLLTGLTSGLTKMMILGDTANTATRSYGIYEVGVDIKASVTNVLRYIIWMTPLDTAHAVKIPSPTTTETIVTTPLLPGLELHIPANTVITGYDGKPVTQISITPVPLDRPPFPLPKVEVPLYFTIQPGSAYLKVMGYGGPQGARLFYPNAYGSAPGTPYEFWNYDPDKRGWYVYGQGRVSPDRSQIIPGPGVEIYEFTGAMVANPSLGGGPGGAPGNNDKGGEPIDLGTGLFIYEKTDLVLPDVIPIVLSRTYRPNDSLARAFGVGTSDPYSIFLVGDNSSNTEGYTYQDLVMPDGSRIHFQRTSPCTGANGFCNFIDAVYEHTSSPTDFYGAVITHGSCPLYPGWKLTKKDGTIFCFPEAEGLNTTSRLAALRGVQDRYGNVLTLTRDSDSKLTRITSPNGRWVQLTYDNSSRIIQAQDSAGRAVGYSYDNGGRLIQVTDANGGIWNYSYDAFGQMLSIQDARGIFYLTNQYDQNGRVIRQTQADNTNFYFNYTIPGGAGTPIATNVITQTDMTDPRGIVTRMTFDANGYVKSETRALGLPEQQTISYTRDANTNLVTAVTDALGRQTSFSYDSLGNMTGITQLSGTQNSVTSTFTYEPAFSQLTSISDPLSHTTTLSRDGSGNLAAITDPLGHQTTLTYNPQGLPLSVTDAAGNTAQFAFQGGDLVGITDPLGNTATRFLDGAGRVATLTDALGRTSRFTYNALNQVLQVTDPLQGVTSFAFDLNGNLLSLTDPLGHTTNWSYDNMDRAVTSKDGLQRQTTYSYDLNGNLASRTDRKGLVTSFTYDALNRPKLIGYNTVVNGGVTSYESTIAFAFDAGNRMTQAVDSAGGTITEAYDNLNRLTTETTPQGSVTYGYDAAGRQTSTTVAGQPQLSYSYDNADRLSQITQGTGTVGFSYDNANRRTSLTLPNGVSVSYGFDNDSRVTGITYNFGANTLGNLTYSYDQLGRRAQTGGSFARTNLPGAVTSTVYDAANELTNWNGTAISYDANGNMLGDGRNTFTWNARNQIATLNSVNLQYDALGRRTKNAAGTSFLFDGANSMQELSGSTVKANIWTGGLDELFQRTDSNGTVMPLVDASGSVIALVNSSGSVVTTYSYDPFGNTTTAGAVNANPSQYTGRENEGNGLYFYRAREYSPCFARFISEDPLGYAGSGTNLYAYAFNSPTNLIDPSGMFSGGGSGGGNAPNLSGRKDKKPPCFAQLKYRPVDDWRAKMIGANHTFWYAQGSDGKPWIISGGPWPQNAKVQNLNVWKNPDVNHGVDNVSAGTWWDSGLSSDNCSAVDGLINAATNWTQDTTRYDPTSGPNSNSAAHALGDAGGFGPTGPTRPPGAVGWDTPIPTPSPTPTPR